MRKNALKNLRVEEISMVHKDATPANEGATVLLTKVFKTNNQEEEMEMSLPKEMEHVLTIEKLLQDSRGKVRKADNFSVQEAEEMIETAANYFIEFDADLTPEQAYVKALKALPTIGGLAMGKDLEIARGSY